MNEELAPYAEWLEGFIENLLEFKPEKIGVCAILPDGNVLTGYYGDVFPMDKAQMGFHMNNDGVLDTVLANAKQIVSAAEEQEDE